MESRPPPEPTIVHADMDAFYASVEQRDRPELRGRPVVVGGLGRRGVVTAASYEARPFGVRSAMPMFEARRRCPEAVFLPGRMEVYAAVSRRIDAVFREMTPLVEPLSLDEAFLDVTASLGLFGGPLALARRLKARVREAVGLTVSVGIGPTKTVAKIASDLGKPDGLLLVSRADAAAFLAPLPAARLPGVGPKLARRLAAAGWRSVGELAQADPARLARVCGDGARRLAALAAGEDPRPVEAGRRRKSYGEENTFPDDIGDGDLVRAAIVRHAEAVARRLRADGRRARTIAVKVRLAARRGPGDYPVRSRAETLAEATDDGAVVAERALALWARLAGPPIRLVGVAASGLEGGTGQLDLFGSDGAGRGGRRAALNRALDRLTARFGEDAVRRGPAAGERASPTLARKDPEPRGSS